MRRKLIVFVLGVSLGAGMVGAWGPSASATAVQRYRGAGKSTLTVTDATTGVFTIDGAARMRRLGLAAVHGDGVRAADGTADYTLTFTLPSGDTVTTSNTATGFRLGRMGVFRSRGAVTGGTGAFAGATGGISTVGAIMKAKASPGVFRARLAFAASITT